jgi:hypothetical protein
MKTKIIPLIGDPVENFYQLGLVEKEAFLKIESRIKNLLSTSSLLQFGQELITRAKVIVHKREAGLFDKCITSYSKGLGIDPARYYTFISLFELAAHFGQTYPELKGILPGCTSFFLKKDDEITHTRLMDFPLVGLFDEAPRLYFWQSEGKEPVLTYGTEGMAPLFLQGVHGSGVSFAIHHKPGKLFFNEGQSIFQIVFETIFGSNNFSELKKELKKKKSITKWAVLLLDKLGSAHILDIEGPSHNFESYNLNETSPLIFTNIPLKKESDGFDSYLRFSEDRQEWLKEKIQSKKDVHILDLMTSIDDQKYKNWLHPVATLSTIGAWHVNLSKGYIDLKEGHSALTSSDQILRVNLAGQNDIKILKKSSDPRPIEIAWKKASKAQCAFDEGHYDIAYHELQMAESVMPNLVWKQIFNFYLCVWDFKFVNNSKELSIVYKKLKSLVLPPILKDQWILLVMRIEKKLDLSPTVFFTDVSKPYQELFQREKLASKPVFATWMKLVYPRMEVLDIFSPHHK